MANIIKIDKLDFCSGPGARVSVWFSGCDFHCEGCHNPLTWKFEQGEEVDNKMILHIIKMLERGYLKDLSILGGEPLHPKNIQTATRICRIVKDYNPQIQIWIWTGYEWEDVKDLEIIKYIDAIKMGRYEKQNHCNHRYFGSSNQYIFYIENSQIKGVEKYECKSNQKE